jgi:hypothetical protein
VTWNAPRAARKISDVSAAITGCADPRTEAANESAAKPQAYLADGDKRKA